MTYKAIRCSSVFPTDREQRTIDCLGLLWNRRTHLDPISPSASLNIAFNNPAYTFKKSTVSLKDDANSVVCSPRVNRMISLDTYHQNFDYYILKEWS